MAPAPLQRPTVQQPPIATPAPVETAPVAPLGSELAQPGVTVPDPAAPVAPTAPVAPEDPGSVIPSAPAPVIEPDPIFAPGPDPTGIDPDLLGADEPETAPTRPLPRPPVVADTTQDAAIARAYEERFRPTENPGRLNLGVRALFANAGGANKVGGRLFGAQIDLGQAWNGFGYALTGSLWGGNVVLSDRASAMNMMVGVGPSLSLGRRALLGRGYLDLRIGYDFFYAAVNRRRDAPVRATSGDVRLEQADNLTPHGPRAQLNMGLLSADRGGRRFTHGFGVSMGYQGLIGSLRGELPFTHMLTLGLSYWLG